MKTQEDYIFDFEVNEENFNRLYMDYYPSLVVFVRKIIGPTFSGEEIERAEDLVQDIFIQLWEGRRKNVVIGNVRAYLFQALKHQCLNALRDEKLHSKIEKSVSLREDIYWDNLYVEQETIRLVYEAIEKLPPKCREIFIKHLDGLSNQEIAVELCIAEETVKKQKKIARKYLNENLKELLLLFLLLRKKIYFFEKNILPLTPMWEIMCL